MSNKEGSPSQHRFLVLDAMRGAAALAVVIYHIAPSFGLAIFKHGYVAVDFFFMLSGFVISYAYQQRLDDGWSTRDFLKVRLIRLYPLYVLSIFISVVWTAANHLRANPQILATKLDICLGLLLLPHIRPGLPAFPLNHPAWSLFGELIANLVHGVVLRRLSNRNLAIYASIAAAIYVVIALQAGEANFGFLADKNPTWPVVRGLLKLLPRVLAPYLFGIILERWWRSSAKPQTWSSLPAFAILIAVLAYPIRTAHSGLFDVITVFVIFPLLLLYSARATCTLSFQKIYSLAGAASYAIYILHMPLSNLCLFIAGKAHPSGAHLASYVWMTAILGLLIASALTADRLYDTPVRTWIRERSKAHGIHRRLLPYRIS
jgi:peptidoglycan/LPS O-acetylase OafA/YrhL